MRCGCALWAAQMLVRAREPEITGTVDHMAFRPPVIVQRYRKKVLVVSVGLALLGLFAALVEPVWSAFTGTTTNSGNTITAAASFPDYPASVASNTPWAYHRSEEAGSAAATLAAADSSSTHPGTFDGITNGPSTRWKFDENAGTTITYDSSGASNSGALSGSPAWVTGMSGSALSFNGSSQYVQSATTAVHTNADFTVTAWANFAGISSFFDQTIVSQNGVHTYGFALRYAYGSNKWAITMPVSDGVSPTIEEAVSTNTAVVGVWVHLAGVYVSSSRLLTLYVDGYSSGTKTRSAAPNTDWDATGLVQAGQARWNDNNYQKQFNGKIDDVRIYRRALPAAEILTLATDQTTTKWDFSEGSGTTTADGARADNTGTLGWVGTSASLPTFTAANAHSGNSVSLPYTDATHYGYVEGSTGGVHTDQSFSVSAWVYISATAARPRAVVSAAGTTGSAFVLKQDSVFPYKWAFLVTATDGGVYSQVSSNSGASTGWTHLVGVYTKSGAGGTIRMYVNGTLQTESASPAADWDATLLEVGRNKWAGVFEAPLGNGQVDNVRLYPRALTGSDVTSALDNDPASIVTEADMTAGIPGALQGAQQGLTATKAVAYAGTANGYNNTAANPASPTTFTLECWFRVAGPLGGTLIGLQANTNNAASGASDRTMYIDSGGKVSFVVKPSAFVSVRSTNSYNDGNWHYAAATLGPTGGTRLYVDGVVVATDSNTSAATITPGYWRWGGVYLYNGSAYPNRPTSDYLVGSIDEVAIYTSELTAQQIARHYYANH